MRKPPTVISAAAGVVVATTVSVESAGGADISTATELCTVMGFLITTGADVMADEVVARTVTATAVVAISGVHLVTAAMAGIAVGISGVDVCGWRWSPLT